MPRAVWTALVVAFFWETGLLAVRAAPDLAIDPGLGGPLERLGLSGVFVAFEPGTGRWVTNDAGRAQRGFLPASTFKIPNSLIALECGAVAGASDILPWDGRDRSIPSWNRDQDMRAAFRNSTIWYYQELARRTGEERMRDWVGKIGYGNADISGGIDVFWLQGALRITAVEQIAFLHRLHEDALPFRPDVMAEVRELMIADQRDGWTLRAKTGMTLRVESPVAWYVGWVETPAKGPVFFALNFDIASAADAAPRLAITFENLVLLGALPEGTLPP
jgi:beta-lactamase class D